jgi:hypothetical protein
LRNMFGLRTCIPEKVWLPRPLDRHRKLIAPRRSLKEPWRAGLLDFDTRCSVLSMRNAFHIFDRTIKESLHRLDLLYDEIERRPPVTVWPPLTETNTWPGKNDMPALPIVWAVQIPCSKARNCSTANRGR